MPITAALKEPSILETIVNFAGMFGLIGVIVLVNNGVAEPTDLALQLGEIVAGVARRPPAATLAAPVPDGLRDTAVVNFRPASFAKTLVGTEIAGITRSGEFLSQANGHRVLKMSPGGFQNAVKLFCL